jgi:muramoyltetrapeptide carboxypeptidase
MWLNEVYGIISLHGEMPLNFSNPEGNTHALRSLQQALFGNSQPCVWDGHFYNKGNATGEITGGNLSLIYSLLGTPADPQTEGKILFIEETGEYFYHIDRMMTSLKLAGKLKGLSAMLIGGMKEIVDAKIPWGMSVEETIYGIVKEYGYPLFFNFPAGHVPDNRAFFMGKQTRIDVKGNKAILSPVD